MKNIVLSFAILMGLALATQSVSAGNHDHHNQKMVMPKMVKEFLMKQWYISENPTVQEYRMAIMAFQKKYGLRETGTLNAEARRMIRATLNLPNITEAAVATPALSTLVTAVTAGGLADTLANKGPFTVFAPTNDAFAKVPSATLSALLTPEKKSDLVNILTYHVVSGKALSTDLKDGQEITTLQGGKLKVKIADGKVYINNAQVIMADVKTENGVVHVIDSVLMP